MKVPTGDAKPKELVVFDILRDSECTECLHELRKGDFLFLENGRPLCLIVRISTIWSICPAATPP
jgi:hypothetical protein